MTVFTSAGDGLCSPAKRQRLLSTRSHATYMCLRRVFRSEANGEPHKAEADARSLVGTIGGPGDPSC